MLSRSDFEYESCRLYVTHDPKTEGCSIIIQGDQYKARSLEKRARVDSIAPFVITPINLSTSSPVCYFASPKIQNQTLIINTSSTELDPIILELMTVYGLFLKLTQNINGIEMNNRYVNLQSIAPLKAKPMPPLLSITPRRVHKRSVSADIEPSEPHQRTYQRSNSAVFSLRTNNPNI